MSKNFTLFQDELYKELIDVFGEGLQPPTLADLSKLNFLEQCIKETLRRFPTAPVVLRRALEDLPINGKFLHSAISSTVVQ